MPGTEAVLSCGLQFCHLFPERPQSPVQSGRLVDALDLPGVAPAIAVVGIIAEVVETTADDILLHPVEDRPKIRIGVASPASIEKLVWLHMREQVQQITAARSHRAGSGPTGQAH